MQLTPPQHIHFVCEGGFLAQTCIVGADAHNIAALLLASLFDLHQQLHLGAQDADSHKNYLKLLGPLGELTANVNLCSDDMQTPQQLAGQDMDKDHMPCKQSRVFSVSSRPGHTVHLL